LIEELRFKLKKTLYKYYLYIKYYKKVLKVKNHKIAIKIEEKMWPKKTFSSYSYSRVKEFALQINTENENPVITQEKERERALHMLFY